MIKITTDSHVTISTGPIAFGDDWPGVFLSAKYLHTHFSYLKDVVLEEDLRNPFEQICKPKTEQVILKNIQEQLEATQDYKDIGNDNVSLKILTIPKFFSNIPTNFRAETGLMEINGIVGYFIRGDNTWFITGLPKQFKDYPGNEKIEEYKNILASCML